MKPIIYYVKNTRRNLRIIKLQTDVKFGISSIHDEYLYIYLNNKHILSTNTLYPHQRLEIKVTIERFVELISQCWV